jgi:protein-S-isoprenylcysteine O-methyltransferase Ste14
MNRKRPSAFPDLVASVLTVCLFAVSIFVDIDEPAWVTGFGLGCLALAIPLAGLPFFHLAKYGKSKQVDAFFDTTQVADRGVYSLVRHPQYLGYMFLVVGFALLDPHPVALGLAVAAVIFFHIQCLTEERFCSQHLGEEYVVYARRVPRINFLVGLLRIVRRHLTKG